MVIVLTLNFTSIDYANAATKKDELSGRAKDMEQRLAKLIVLLNDKYKTKEAKALIGFDVLVNILSSIRSELEMLSQSVETMAQEMPEQMFTNFEKLYELLENSFESSIKYLEKIKADINSYELGIKTTDN